MRCKSCNIVIPDGHLAIDDELCQPCLRIVHEAIKEMELEQLKKENKKA